MHFNSMNGIFSLKMEDDAHDDWPAIKTISLLQVRGEKNNTWKKTRITGTVKWSVFIIVLYDFH